MLSDRTGRQAAPKSTKRGSTGTAHRRHAIQGRADGTGSPAILLPMIAGTCGELGNFAYGQKTFYLT